MSVKAIYEYSAKRIIKKFFKWDLGDESVLVTSLNGLDECVEHNQWLRSQKLVCKPDVLVKRRGKLGLVIVNASIDVIRNWISERLNKTITVSRFQISVFISRLCIFPICLYLTLKILLDFIEK